MAAGRRGRGPKQAKIDPDNVDLSLVSLTSHVRLDGSESACIIHTLHGWTGSTS